MKTFKLEPRYKDAFHFRAYWGNGNGKDIVEWSKANLNFDDFYNQCHLYYEVDELGDQVIQEFYTNQSFKEANSKLETYIRSGIPNNEEVPESVKALFEFTECVPEWLNEDLLQLGAEACMKTGRDALMSLRDYSLMGGYDYAYLSKPLVFTGALKKGALKRLSETLDFWINVTRTNAMAIHAKGYEFAIKTRLIHSYARFQLKKHVKDWDYEEMGEPINLWDMTATSNGFSLVLLHGLKKLGNSFTEEEEKGMFHLWKYISYLMGVPAEYLPGDKKEATENFFLWTSIQPPADQDSVYLAQSLVQESLENPILKHQFQRNFLNYIHVSSSKFLLDNEVFERLELPLVWNANLIPKSLKFGNKVMQKYLSRETQIKRGDKLQMDILQQYLSITN
ncbi:oxygenase MpaB family protein [Brumimicrobium mesophilum]|uniref:oxygenase MpaB family protein n=1 Tax=Brumimicrobium mesophilum TaxID=392717 RepID=UPI000D1447C0|nr:oxygenase MpaB family protein [Brumimicrobium mesophilum]